jgi:hypothetical protein
MQEIQLYLNGFKVRKYFLPQKVLKFRIHFFEEEESERFRTVKGTYNAVPLNSVNETIVEVISWKKTKDIEENKCEQLSLHELPVDRQEELVLLYLKNELNIIPKLRRHLPIPREDYRKNVLITPDIKKLTLKKINDDFYLFFDVGYRIRSLRSVYDLVVEGKLSYQELIGKKLIYDPHGTKRGERSLVEVINIDFNPTKEEIENISRYLSNKYGLQEPPSNIPILHIRFKSNKNKIYSTFPHLCFHEKRDFTYKLVISNKDRKRILENLASKLDFLEDNPLFLSGRKFSNPQYIVRTKNGKFKKVTKLIETTKYPALFIPKELYEQQEVPIFVLVDSKLPKKEVENFLAYQIKKGYLKLNKEGNPFRFKAIRKSPKEISFQVNFQNFTIPNEIREAIRNSPISFSLCICKSLSKEDYDKMKRKLFIKNIISQAVIYDKWKQSSQYISQVLAFNIYSKLGIKLFTLAEKLPYDLILGVDVGNNRFNKRSKASSIAVFLSNGIIKMMFPISIDTNGEKIDFFGELLEILVEKLDVENKKILILRDGNIYRKELENLASSYITIEKSLSIDIVNVKKNHAFRILSDEGKKLYYLMIVKAYYYLIPLKEQKVY